MELGEVMDESFFLIMVLMFVCCYPSVFIPILVLALMGYGFVGMWKEQKMTEKIITFLFPNEEHRAKYLGK